MYIVFSKITIRTTDLFAFIIYFNTDLGHETVSFELQRSQFAFQRRYHFVIGDRVVGVHLRKPNGDDGHRRKKTVYETIGFLRGHKHVGGSVLRGG